MKTCVCGAELETREQLRRGYCTEICQRLHQPKFRPARSSSGRVTGWSSRPSPNRIHGADRKKVSGAE